MNLVTRIAAVIVATAAMGGSGDYFEAADQVLWMNSYRPALANPTHYRCPYCGGELIIDRHPNLKQPEIPLAISRGSVIIKTVTLP